MPDLELTRESFRAVASRYATGVVLVTTISDGFDHAMTATSFTTVSLDPMLALVCVENDTRFHDALGTDDTSYSVGSPPKDWAISIMPATGQPVASWFATKGRPLQGQFDRVGVHRGPATGAILLDSALACMELRTVNEYVQGDHLIVVGKVLSLWIQADHVDESEPDPRSRPLGYWARRYRRFAD